MAVRTSAANPNFVQQAITLRPERSRISYRVANPLGVYVGIVTPAAIARNPAAIATGDVYSLGYTPDASNVQETSQGNTTGVTPFGVGRAPDLLATTFGQVADGAAKTTVVSIFDRSLLTLLNGQGRGLTGVRVNRGDLEWQGGAASVAKGLVAAHGSKFAPFEDMPVNSPNTSLDYPDIRREQLSVTKDPNGDRGEPALQRGGAQAADWAERRDPRREQR